MTDNRLRAGGAAFSRNSFFPLYLLVLPYQHSWAAISMTLRRAPWCTSPGSRPPPSSTSPSSTPPSRSTALSPSSSVFARGERRSEVAAAAARNAASSCVPRRRCGLWSELDGSETSGRSFGVLLGSVDKYTHTALTKEKPGSPNLPGTFRWGHVPTKAWAQLSCTRECVALDLTRGWSGKSEGPCRYVHHTTGDPRGTRG